MNYFPKRPKGLPRVTEEMKIIIGSAIIQITFGLDRYLLEHFDRIYVLPRPYRFKGFQEPLLGHVDFKEKVICFSWKDVQEGFEVPDDAVNVALHEMAHVLEAEHELSGLYQEVFPPKIWTEWEAVSKQILMQLQAGQLPLLKKYAAKNRIELFAVCIETFFEQPEPFKKELPGLYDLMCRMLQKW